MKEPNKKLNKYGKPKNEPIYVVLDIIGCVILFIIHVLIIRAA